MMIKIYGKMNDVEVRLALHSERTGASKMSDDEETKRIVAKD
jgi:hypothetical protein